MNCRVTTIRCTREQIRNLLKIGLLEEDEFEPPQEDLARNSGLTISDHEMALGELRRRLSDPSIPAGDRLWREALVPVASLDRLVVIKEAAKILHESSSGARERDASTALYYLAVAAARVYRHVSISSIPLEELKQSFATIAGGCGEEAGELFRIAAKME